MQLQQAILIISLSFSVESCIYTPKLVSILPHNVHIELEKPAALNTVVQHSTVISQTTWSISCAPFTSEVIGVSTIILQFQIATRNF